MAAHRYWRAISMEAYGNADLELSTFHLLAAGVRVDASATLTANAAPDVSGSLANLQDDSLTTSARWSGLTVRNLVLTWDLGVAPAEVSDIRLSGDDASRFALIVGLQYSADGVVWLDLWTWAGIAWPGAGVKTQSSGQGVDDSFKNIGFYCRFDGVNGHTTALDSGPKNLAITRVTAGSVDASQSVFGGSSWLGAVSGSLQLAQDLNNITAAGATPWTWEARIRLSILALAEVVFDNNNNGSNTTGWLIYVGSDGKLYIYSGTQGANYGGFGTGMAINTWYALRITWDGTSLRFFRDGALLGTNTGFTNAWGNSVFVANSAFLNQAFTGWIDELRWTKGVALSTAAYAVASTPFGAGVLQNTARGRAAPVSAITLGTGPAIVYGTPTLEAPVHLTVESGSVKDMVTGMLGTGIGRVRGTVKIEAGVVDLPVARRVRLLRESDLLVVREQWSDPTTGAYDFRFVDELQRYIVVTQDHTQLYSAVVADNLTPEPMP